VQGAGSSGSLYGSVDSQNPAREFVFFPSCQVDSSDNPRHVTGGGFDFPGSSSYSYDLIGGTEYVQTTASGFSASEASTPAPVLAAAATIACLWPSCNTFHLSGTVLLAHWKAAHMPAINALSRRQRTNTNNTGQSSSPKCFCLWNNNCHKEFRRPSDLDRHVQSIHLEFHRDCPFAGCANNNGRGFGRRDKIRGHMKEVHGL